LAENISLSIEGLCTKYAQENIRKIAEIRSGIYRDNNVSSGRSFILTGENWYIGSFHMDFHLLYIQYAYATHKLKT
jgi:hypothetical protein